MEKRIKRLGQNSKEVLYTRRRREKGEEIYEDVMVENFPKLLTYPKL